MERGIITVDARHTVRGMRTSMQGNVIRALVELITNSDDSYIRLEDEKNNNSSGVIMINYVKEGYKGLFAVRDYAEGMSIDDVRTGFKIYGKATSGRKSGKRVRGYFGQGAKDALGSMINGRICTFKNDQFVECRLFIEEDKPWYEIEDPIVSSSKLRKEHKIDGNGTIAYFEADRQITGPVPRLKTVQAELVYNFLLRKIMTNPKRKIYLEGKDAGKARRLRYVIPKGKEILTDYFTISYSDYGEFPIHISIWRADNELTQAGDDREGGLLIVDDEEIVLDISLFKFDNEPLASHFYGEVEIGRFRELLEKEEPVLKEDRDGLIPRHPFCKKLIPEIEKRIEEKVNEERLRREKETKSKIDREETTRYKKAFTMLNNIAEMEVQEIVNLGAKPTDQIEAPPNGFCIYPSSAQITVGKRYGFELRIDTRTIHHGSVIQVSCTNTKIHVVTPQIKISYEDGTGIIQKYITIEGKEPNINGVLRAITSNNIAEAKIFVIPEKELLLSEGMAFQPESVTVRPNKPKKVSLLIYIKMIEGGSTIKITKDNESINTSTDEIIVNEYDAVRHIAKYELEVWGEEADQTAVITAEYETYLALLEVRVRHNKDKGDENRKGMFSDHDFSLELNPLQRTSYSTTTGKVMIYLNFPSIRHYLGETRQYNKTLSAQVLVADLVSERCFYEIAKKKVDLSGVLIRPEGRLDAIQSKANEFSRLYGEKLHKTLVDQKLIEEAKSYIQNSNTQR